MDKTTHIQALNRSYNGMKSRADGVLFEQLIEQSCERYKLENIAYIEKTPEPMKPLSRPNAQGHFSACYTKFAQPDFKGTLHGGQAVVFEAKYTSCPKMAAIRVTPEQTQALEKHYRLGACVFVLISFNMQDFYTVPWSIWRAMKEEFGRQYVTSGDSGLQKYRIKLGLKGLDFLESDHIRNTENSKVVESFNKSLADAHALYMSLAPNEEQCPKEGDPNV